MRVLFIGGTGNISASVSRLCVESGIALTLLTRGERNAHLQGVESITCDLAGLKEVKEVCNGRTWDVVVDWIAFNEKDIDRDFELFCGNTGQYIFISSASVYQKPPLHPVITESTPLWNPFWEYARNKIACEEKLNFYYRNSDFPITIVRPSLTYDTVIPVPIGGWTEYTIIDRIRKGKKIIVHGDGTSLLTITHAEDFAKGFIGLMGHQHAIGQTFHITSDEIVTWNQIYEAIADAVGIKANILHVPSDYLARINKNLSGTLLGDKSWSVIFDNTKIKTFVPGFAATIPFNKGIKRTLKWFESDPSRQIIRSETNDMIDRIIASFEGNRLEL